MHSNNWKDVKIELPNDFHDVAICVNGKYTGFANYEFGKFVNPMYENFNHDMVTHWQPLPKAFKQ